MFIIRKQHMEAFAGVAMRNYEDRLLEHVRESFPEQVKTDGDAKTRETIQAGIQSARRHSLLTERDAALYIEVMYILGPEFETDPRYPWAGEILQGTGNGAPAGKAERLHARASEAARATDG